ncbi:hypothetical protein AURDEDRAFT_57009 [Auricularia subglabra TFB-10046 SS5]|nr:hypothetical protein AURDEDRAFT_57009 [Auricularia subglabra TFB-10046 SS5]
MHRNRYANDCQNSTGRVFLQNARTVLRRNTQDSGLEITWSAALRSHPIFWKRGDSNVHIDRLVIPQPPGGGTYLYRVLKDETDLGVRPTYLLEADGSQVVNLLEYNQGYGIHDSRRVRVFVGEEGSDGREILIADRTSGAWRRVFWTI